MARNAFEALTFFFFFDQVTTGHIKHNYIMILLGVGTTSNHSLTANSIGMLSRNALLTSK